MSALLSAVLATAWLLAAVWSVPEATVDPECLAAATDEVPPPACLTTHGPEDPADGDLTQAVVVSRDAPLSDPPSAAAVAIPASARVSLVRPIQFQSQLREASPAAWQQDWTPYCAAASSIMVIREIDAGLVKPDQLAHTFRIGRRGNTTDDPGLDPDGIAYLMQSYGGEGRIHAHRSALAWLDDVVGRLNHGVAVVALTLAGDHAVTVYGYEAVRGGEITALFVADPLSEYVGPVPIDDWFESFVWMGARFAAPGPQWHGTYVFVTYSDFR